MICFWYILFPGKIKSSTTGLHNDDDGENTYGVGGNDNPKIQLLRRLQAAELKLVQLEKKNLRNEAIITDLR